MPVQDKVDLPFAHGMVNCILIGLRDLPDLHFFTVSLAVWPWSRSSKAFSRTFTRLPFSSFRASSIALISSLLN